MKENRPELACYFKNFPKLNIYYTFSGMNGSPSTKHQRISGRLNAKLFNLLETKECEVFQAPFDVELCSEKVEGNKVVIPDLLVICDKSGLGENKFVGKQGYL